MEDYIQFSAKTKSEAITKACIELGVSSDQLEIQVISEGSNGFFGIGSKPAVIKVRNEGDRRDSETRFLQRGSPGSGRKENGSYKTGKERNQRAESCF